MTYTPAASPSPTVPGASAQSSGSASYAAKEFLGLRGNLASKPRYRPTFYIMLSLATIAGVMMNVVHLDPMRALFVAAVINFLIIGFVAWRISKIFIKPAAEAPKRTCPFCRMSIDAAATRCPNCTSQLAAG